MKRDELGEWQGSTTFAGEMLGFKELSHSPYEHESCSHVSPAFSMFKGML